MPDKIAAPGDEYSEHLASRGLPSLAPAQPRDRGEGPFARLILRRATLIDGTGAPPWGPVDIVVEGDRITGIHAVDTPHLAIAAGIRSEECDRELDCHGKFVTPGFIDCHAHIGWPAHAARGAQPGADYIYKC